MVPAHTSPHPTPQDNYEPDTNEVVRIILKKRNWSAPGTDRIRHVSGGKSQNPSMRELQEASTPYSGRSLTTPGGLRKEKPHLTRNLVNFSVITRDRSLA